MTELEALVALNLVYDIGGIRLRKLLEVFQTPQNILRAPRQELMAVSGIGEKIAAKINALKKEDVDKELRLVKNLGLEILTQGDSEYPQNLKNIYDPPIVLYMKGAIKEEDNRAIAIVGSRRASFYGLSSAEKFAAELSLKGFTIVSGMARGIDTSAHRGALKRGGRTIAVIGSGFKHIYPQENKELCEEIARNGAVLSEFPVETEPLKQNFPRRNRVISGLSLGVLVAEAARNSGALITADFALEQGREVFALPGKVDSGTSFGTNGLIKQGAKLVTCADDILEEINLDIATISDFAKCPTQDLAKQDNTKYKIENLERNLASEEAKLYLSISEEPASLDELVEKTSLDISRISDILLRLRLKKMIEELPGKQFVRSLHEG